MFEGWQKLDALSVYSVQCFGDMLEGLLNGVSEEWVPDTRVAS